MSWRTEYWETMDQEGDKMVMNIFTEFESGSITITELFERIENIPYLCDNAEICKETTNKVFEHLINDFNMDEDEIDFIYNSVRMRLCNYKRSDFTESEIESDAFLSRYFNSLL